MTSTAPAGPTAPPPTLQLLVQEVDQQVTQLRWLDADNADLSYKVRRGALVDAALQVRSQLHQFLRSYMLSRDNAATLAALGQLVRAGRELFDALFAAQGSPRAADARRQYLALDAAGRLKILLKVDPTLMFPWSLTVPPSVATPAEGWSPHRLDGVFWSLRHDLSISTFGAPGARREPVGPLEFGALALMHRRIHDDVIATLTDPLERQRLHAVIASATRGLTFATGDFEQAIDRLAADRAVTVRLAYLLGHAHGSRFQFSASDELSASRLATKLDNTVSGNVEQHTILFLNGCETVGEGERFSFAELAGEFSVGAIIGTEVKVPDRFAFRFAVALLHAVLCEGATLRNALDRLRREHLPLSLAYALYAADGLRIQPSQRPGDLPNPDPSTAPLGANYSREALTCKG